MQVIGKGGVGNTKDVQGDCVTWYLYLIQSLPVVKSLVKAEGR